jgi:hypothetical protein
MITDGGIREIQGLAALPLPPHPPPPARGDLTGGTGAILHLRPSPHLGRLRWPSPPPVGRTAAVNPRLIQSRPRSPSSSLPFLFPLRSSALNQDCLPRCRSWSPPMVGGRIHPSLPRIRPPLAWIYSRWCSLGGVRCAWPLGAVLPPLALCTPIPASGAHPLGAGSPCLPAGLASRGVPLPLLVAATAPSASSTPSHGRHGRSASTATAMVVIVVAAHCFWLWDMLPSVVVLLGVALLSFYPALLQLVRSVDRCSLLADGIVQHGDGSLGLGESLA